MGISERVITLFRSQSSEYRDEALGYVRRPALPVSQLGGAASKLSSEQIEGRSMAPSVRMHRALRAQESA